MNNMSDPLNIFNDLKCPRCNVVFTDYEWLDLIIGDYVPFAVELFRERSLRAKLADDFETMLRKVQRMQTLINEILDTDLVKERNQLKAQVRQMKRKRRRTAQLDDDDTESDF
tara:strand:- start:39 stop:377 length:339 start_codon:yes stop_codon:yes gene_type:complete